MIHVWAGLRPQTFDQRPFIGHHPEEEGILFATGHYRNGILLAPATGQMIRDLILKREIKNEWVEAFKIDRRKPLLVIVGENKMSIRLNGRLVDLPEEIQYGSTIAFPVTI